jgi:hypothetical protein
MCQITVSDSGWAAPDFSFLGRVQPPDVSGAIEQALRVRMMRQQLEMQKMELDAKRRALGMPVNEDDGDTDCQRAFRVLEAALPSDPRYGELRERRRRVCGF